MKGVIQSLVGICVLGVLTGCAMPGGGNATWNTPVTFFANRSAISQDSGAAQGDSMNGAEGNAAITLPIGTTLGVVPTPPAAPPGPVVERLEAPSVPVVHMYTVKRGDTVSSIAQRYGLEVSDIVRANRLSNKNRIYAGQRIVIP